MSNKKEVAADIIDERQLEEVRKLLSEARIGRLAIEDGHSPSAVLASQLRPDVEPIRHADARRVLAACSEDVTVASLVPVVADGGNYVSQAEGGISNIRAIIAAHPYAVGKLAVNHEGLNIMAVVVGPRI